MSEIIYEKDLLAQMEISKSGLRALKIKKGFPQPILKYPARYDKKAIEEWFNRGGVSQNV